MNELEKIKRCGFEDSQLNLFQNLETDEQRREVRRGLEDFLPVRKVSVYANSFFSKQAMNFARNALLQDWTEENVTYCLEQYGGDSVFLDELRKAIYELDQTIVMEILQPSEYIRDIISVLVMHGFEWTHVGVDLDGDAFSYLRRKFATSIKISEDMKKRIDDNRMFLDKLEKELSTKGDMAYYAKLLERIELLEFACLRSKTLQERSEAFLSTQVGISYYLNQDEALDIFTYPASN
ncbi:MAG: hypothetical protein R3Y54_01985 [Eubacteriales bacterium]